MAFGSAIHELFEKVEWAEATDVEGIVGAWVPRSVHGDAVTRDVADQFRACMSSDVVRQRLTRPQGDVTLWREKRFEVLLGGELVAGAFDRVTIVRWPDGGIASACIVDFKSSRSADIDRRAGDYRPQMETYRDALAEILGIERKRVSCVLLFTRQQQVREL